jgi:hypothetical protein
VVPEHPSDITPELRERLLSRAKLRGQVGDDAAVSFESTLGA